MDFWDYSFWVRQLLWIFPVPYLSVHKLLWEFLTIYLQNYGFLGPPTHSGIVHFGSTNSFGDYLFWIHQLHRGLFILGPPTPSWIIHFGSTPYETLDFLGPIVACENFLAIGIFHFSPALIFFFSHCPTSNFSHSFPSTVTLYCTLYMDTWLMVPPLIL